MTKLIAAALFSVLAGTLAVHVMTPEMVAHATAVQASFDIAMPAPAESIDTSVVTAKESTGTAHNE